MLVIFLMTSLLLPSRGLSGERCSQFNGNCRNACAANEMDEEGDFLDCTEKQHCCVVRRDAKDGAGCCVLSLEPRDFSPANCIRPEADGCGKGSASPAACETLRHCGRQP